MLYYAKSVLSNGKHPTVREHLEKVSALASEFGAEISMQNEARIAGMFHDFGKYSEKFQKVLTNDLHHIDHALPGAVLLKGYKMMIGRTKYIIEVINGHHDGLQNYALISRENPADGKNASIVSTEEYTKAQQAFQQDFPDFRFPSIPHQHFRLEDQVESMLYTRMLFSCLVDADYSVSASDLNESYLEETTNAIFDPKELLDQLTAYRNEIRNHSSANPVLNLIRDQFYERCGNAGEENPEGLFTLTGPTGVGKTLALLHFALRHCAKWNKKRIIVVLPFLSLTEQTVKEYQHIMDSILEDTSQAEWMDEAREYAARWSTPVIITTSVKFFESLFCDRPTDCRKLHHIANSVILFDEAQSLPKEVMGCTLLAVQEFCKRYHTTMVFSTATQPDFQTILPSWQPKEIYPDNAGLFQLLKRVNTEWRIKEETPLSYIAQEMGQMKSVCAIVNLRRHARELFDALTATCSEEECFFLTTDLCPAHRSDQIENIKKRLKEGKPCRVVATQCIEAGVDLDFDVMFRALAPLEAIIQAAGRCNRNGRIQEGGRVIVFVPSCAGRLYPGNWYNQGAVTVAQMYAEQGSLDLSDPALVQSYYQLLFQHQSDKAELTFAIKERDYAKTRKEYRLIENKGVQIIVPYGRMSGKYAQIKQDLVKNGLKPAQMKEYAPYTVTCPLPEDIIRKFAEAIPLPYHKKKTNSEDDHGSGYYVLHPQCIENYTAKMGLQIRNENNDIILF